jgi:perosamine synthetase
MKRRISYTKPSITALEIGYAVDAATNGWGEKCYDYLNRFEAAFGEHLGVKHVIATSSCTGALHMGLAALGIRPNDEIIVADTNWIATVAPIVHLGATPVLADILPDTWCIDPTQVEQALTPRTKAIIATHLYGNLCNMDELLQIARSHQIPIIEDAAEAIGATYHGTRAGALGDFGCFSFHGTKTITTGEGGAFVTNDPDLYERVLTLSNHGRARNQTKQFWPDVVGYKYKMSNIQAAIGLGQVERISELVEKKRAIMNYYRESLECDEIRLNTQTADTEIGAWMPNAVFSVKSGVTREKLQAAFNRENIDARVFFYPLSSLPMFSGAVACKWSHDIAQRAINLPSFHDITHEEQDRIIAVIRECLSAS